MPATISAQAFVDKWCGVQLDLYHLIDHPTPVEADATGESPCKELVGQRDRWLNPGL